MFFARNSILFKHNFLAFECSLDVQSMLDKFSNRFEIGTVHTILDRFLYRYEKVSDIAL